MSDVVKEVSEEAQTVKDSEPAVESTEAPAAGEVAPASDAAPAADGATAESGVKAVEPIVQEAPVKETVEKVVDQFENLTIFGNKSLEELHQIQSKKSHLSAGILFTDPALKIPQPILESLTLEMRFEKPSEIQASTLPLILDGHNVIAQAQSGAGKTIAFVIGMLAKINPAQAFPQALCLTPTRELANQILSDAVRPLSSRMKISYEDALPGRDLAPGATCTSQIVVGTPGTVKRWITRDRYLRPQSLRIFVLDEADKMVEEKALGADTLAIRKLLAPTAQILFFSATYTKEIIAYARQIVPKAYLVTPRSTEELVLDVIFQVRMDVRKCKGGKLQILRDIYDFMTLQQSIVFVEMKTAADEVAAMMRAGGFEVSVLHGNLQPAERDQVMDDFRAGRTKVLITTNILARGVDVPAVAVVVNYDLPVVRQMNGTLVADEATYLHRIGRCGRFGRRGTAINFLDGPQDEKLMLAIEQHYSPGKRMTTEWDPTDVEGLSEAIKSRPEGGEIAPAAHGGSGGDRKVDVSVFI